MKITMSGRMMLRTAFQNAKTSVNGCNLPASCGLEGAITGGVAEGIGGGTGEGGGGEGSDSIIASDRHQFIAQARRFTRIQTRDDNAGMLGARSVQQQGCESKRTFDGAAVQIDVLQPRQGEELMDTKPDAALCLEHFAVDAVAPRFVRPGWIPKEQDDAKQQEQVPADDRPQPAVRRQPNTYDCNRRHAEQDDGDDGVAHPPKFDDTPIEIPKLRFGDDRHDGGGFGRIHNT